MSNSNDESVSNYININLAEFEIYTKTLLANNVKEIRHRWAVDNYTNSSKIDIIRSLIIYVRSEICSNKDVFIPICRYQISEIDGLTKIVSTMAVKIL